MLWSPLMLDHRHASDEIDQAKAKPDLRPKLEQTPNPLARDKANGEVKDNHHHRNPHMHDLTDPLELDMETDLHLYAFVVERKGT